MEQVEIQEQQARDAQPRCSHCYGTGWVVMGAENDFDEYEEFYALCRKCGPGSVDYGERAATGNAGA